MAINPNDTSYGIIAETTAGTTPTSGVYLAVPYIPGSMPSWEVDLLESQAISTSRSSLGARRVNYRAGGALKVHFQRSSAIDLMLESACSGAFTSNVLKCGSTDKSFTIEKKQVNAGTPYYYRFAGVQCTKVGLAGDATGNAEATFDLVGMSRPTSGTASALTYGAAPTTTPLTGLDLAITIPGITADFYSFDFSIEHTREAQPKMGASTARGIGTSGNRKVKLTTTFYREDLTPDTVLTGSPVSVTLTFSSGANGYTINLPNAYPNVPQDSEDGSKSLVAVEWMASYDGTALTDVVITRT